MSFFERVDQILHAELMTLSGVPVTLASVLVCVLVFAVFVVIARFTARATRRAIESRGRSPGAAAAASKIVWYLVAVLGLVISLDTLGLKLTALLAGSAVLLVGIGFGLQNIAQNFISGIILLVERPIKEGDFIQVGSTFGAVSNIGLRGTTVITRDAVTIIVPNSELVSTQVVNLSVPTNEMRMRVSVGVEYGSNTSRVRDELMRVAAENDHVLAEPPPEVRFDSFGESSLDFSLLVWIREPSRDMFVASMLRFAIDDGFRKAGIVIAFPQRDLHIRSGLEVLTGGRKDALAPTGAAHTGLT